MGVFSGILSLFGALILILKSGFCFHLLFQMSTLNNFLFKGDNFYQFVVIPPLAFFFKLLFHSVYNFPWSINMHLGAIPSIFIYVENYPTFVHHLSRENFIPTSLLVSLCLLFLFDLAKLIVSLVQ